MRAPDPTSTHSSPVQPAPWASDSRSPSSVSPGSASTRVNSRGSSVNHTPGPEVRLPVINQPLGPPAIGPTLVAVTPPYWTRLAGTSTNVSPSIRKVVTRGLPWAPPDRAPTTATRSCEQATELRIARRPQ